MSDIAFVDSSVEDTCKNHEDSYGEVCVGCNACGRIDKSHMYRDYLTVLLRHRQESLSFTAWAADPVLRSIQEANVVENLRYYDELIDQVRPLADKELSDNNGAESLTSHEHCSIVE